MLPPEGVVAMPSATHLSRQFHSLSSRMLLSGPFACAQLGMGASLLRTDHGQQPVDERPADEHEERPAPPTDQTTGNGPQGKQKRKWGPASAGFKKDM